MGSATAPSQAPQESAVEEEDTGFRAGREKPSDVDSERATGSGALSCVGWPD